MNRLRNPPAILAVTMTTLIGGSTGSLGGAVFAVVFAVVGALWGVGLVLLALRLSQSPGRRQTWANAVLFAIVLAAGFVTGAGLMAQLLMSAALDSRPQVFADLVRGSIGNAEALPFYVFNTPLEWVLVPAAIVLTWNNPRRRRLMLTALILWTFHRVWTYTWFVPQITGWGEGDPGTPLTTDQLDQARTWVNLSWIRGAIDVSATVLALLAAFTPALSREPVPRS